MSLEPLTPPSRITATPPRLRQGGEEAAKTPTRSYVQERAARGERVPNDVAIALKQHYRQLAWRRQDYRCLYCTRRLPLPEVTADHRIARVKGGRDEAVNIDATCERCNTLKDYYGYGQFLLAINKPDLRRDGWDLHMAGVEVRVMRAAAQALDRLRSILLPGGAGEVARHAGRRGRRP